MTDSELGESCGKTRGTGLPAANASPGGVNAAIAAARELAASGTPWFWFDGETPAPGEARVSYLGSASAVRIAEAGGEAAFLAALRDELAELPIGSEPAAAGRGFADGWVIALGYEFGVGLLGLPTSAARQAHGEQLGGSPAADSVPAADTAGDPATVPAASAFALRIDEVITVSHDLAESERAGADRAHPALPVDGSPSHGNASWRQSEAAYAEHVSACQAAIRDGDAYVLCLTDSASLVGSWDPLDVYLRLRAQGGAVRGGIIVAGDRALVSMSPERFLSVADGAVSTHPIKGTRPRGVTPADDDRLAAELAADPKERAENLMIVDLMRNDLSRVCEVGSVRVDGFLRVERHAHVHQLVSTVTGMLAGDADVFDAIAATFPGGSMTGAPKRRAVEILGGLEGGPRGLYSGCFGWIDRSGDAELAMTIRGIEFRGIGRSDGNAIVGAGGGITADSDPESELREKQLKARPLLAALTADPRYS